MIRFLNLQNQIAEGENDFCFFDTITDTIVTFADQQVFSSIEEFKEAYASHSYKAGYTGSPIERFLCLIPADYFDEK